MVQQNEKVRFIRVRGRVVPIRSKAGIAHAEQLGKSAQKTGIKSAPALDRKFMSMIKKGKFQVGESLYHLKAWQKGWHSENLSAKIPPKGRTSP